MYKLATISVGDLVMTGSTPEEIISRELEYEAKGFCMWGFSDWFFRHYGKNPTITISTPDPQFNMPAVQTFRPTVWMIRLQKDLKIEEDTRFQIDKAITRIPYHLQRVLKMKYRDKMSVGEIAAFLDARVQSVKTMLSTGKSALRKQYRIFTGEEKYY